MKTVLISKTQAIAILSIMAPKDAVTYAEQLSHDVKAGRQIIPWFGPDGTKVGARKCGCVIRYYVTGYAHDGSDVDRCLARIALNELSATTKAMVAPFLPDGFR